MVARLPLTLRVEPMRLADIEPVHAIERASFPIPWPSYAFRQQRLDDVDRCVAKVRALRREDEQ